MKAKNGKTLLITGITLFVAMVIATLVGLLPRCLVPVIAGLALFLAGLGGVVMEPEQEGKRIVTPGPVKPWTWGRRGKDV